MNSLQGEKALHLPSKNSSSIAKVFFSCGYSTHKGLKQQEFSWDQYNCIGDAMAEGDRCEALLIERTPGLKRWPSHCCAGNSNLLDISVCSVNVHLYPDYPWRPGLLKNAWRCYKLRCLKVNLQATIKIANSHNTIWITCTEHIDTMCKSQRMPCKDFWMSAQFVITFVQAFENRPYL